MFGIFGLDVRRNFGMILIRELYLEDVIILGVVFLSRRILFEFLFFEVGRLLMYLVILDLFFFLIVRLKFFNRELCMIFFFGIRGISLR